MKQVLALFLALLIPFLALSVEGADLPDGASVAAPVEPCAIDVDVIAEPGAFFAPAGIAVNHTAPINLNKTDNNSEANIGHRVTPAVYSWSEVGKPLRLPFTKPLVVAWW